jgi:phage virion morphogenesis protein
LKSGLKQLISEISKTKPLMKAIALEVQKDIQSNFKDQSSPEGLAWEKLSDVTIQNRRSRKKKPRKKSVKILMDTGVLRMGIQRIWDNTTAHWGLPSLLKYGELHQFGAKKGQFGIQSVTIKSYIRKHKKGNVKSGRKIIARGISVVKEHTRRIAIPWGDVPKRPFIGISPESRERIIKMSIEYINFINKKIEVHKNVK